MNLYEFSQKNYIFYTRMERLYLLLGGNLGDKKQIFSHTINLLKTEIGSIETISSIYETEPWGFQSDDLFWNQALVLLTDFSPYECLEKIHQIEKKIGRIRTNHQYTSRIIDIDILFYNDLVMDEPELQIPHPRMIERNFVLVPLAEIAPEKFHPVFRKTVDQMLADCQDKLKVQKAGVQL